MSTNIFTHRSKRSLAASTDAPGLLGSSSVSYLEQDTPRSLSIRTDVSSDTGNRDALYNHSRSTSITFVGHPYRHASVNENQLEKGATKSPIEMVVSLSLFPSIGYPSSRPTTQDGSPLARSMSDGIVPAPKMAAPPKAVPLPGQDSGLSPWHERAFVLTICLAQLFSLAGLAQSFAPLPLIAKDLNVSNPGEMAWLTASYSMTLGSFILPAGRLVRQVQMWTLRPSELIENVGRHVWSQEDVPHRLGMVWILVHDCWIFRFRRREYHVEHVSWTPGYRTSISRAQWHRTHRTNLSNRS